MYEQQLSVEIKISVSENKVKNMPNGVTKWQTDKGLLI